MKWLLASVSLLPFDLPDNFISKFFEGFDGPDFELEFGSLSVWDFVAFMRDPENGLEFGSVGKWIDTKDTLEVWENIIPNFGVRHSKIGRLWLLAQKQCERGCVLPPLKR